MSDRWRLRWKTTAHSGLLLYLWIMPEILTHTKGLKKEGFFESFPPSEGSLCSKTKGRSFFLSSLRFYHHAVGLFRAPVQSRRRFTCSDGSEGASEGEFKINWTKWEPCFDRQSGRRNPGKKRKEKPRERYLDVGRVLVGVLDVREPVSGRFGEVFGLRDEPQHLGPAWTHRVTKQTSSCVQCPGGAFISWRCQNKTLVFSFIVALHFLLFLNCVYQCLCIIYLYCYHQNYYNYYFYDYFIITMNILF